MSATGTGERVRPRVAEPVGVPAERTRRPRRRSRARLRIVRDRSPRRRRWALALVSAVVIGGLLVAIVATQALVSQTSFHMRDLQAKAKALRQTNTQLTLRVADLSAPDRIVAEARSLGLGLPDSAAVQVLRPPGSRPDGGAGADAGRTGGAASPAPEGTP
jgi:cell division protein FtsL